MQVAKINVEHYALSNLQHSKCHNGKAPLIKVCINSANESYELEVLPDSGADILTTGQQALQHLIMNEHVSCLSSSVVIPKPLNGTKLYPLGKIALHL